MTTHDASCTNPQTQPTRSAWNRRSDPLHPPHKLARPASRDHKHLAKLSEVVKRIPEQIGFHPHSSAVMIFSDEDDIWRGTLRCDARDQSEFQRSEEKMREVAHKAHRLIVGVYDRGEEGRDWLNDLAARWSKVEMVFAVDKETWASNTQAQAGVAWQERDLSEISSRVNTYCAESQAPAAVSGIHHGESSPVPAQVRALYREGLQKARRRRDQALSTGIWHMADVWDWIVEELETFDGYLGSATKRTFWTESLVLVVAAISAQMEVASERERMLVQVTVPAELEGSVSTNSVLAGTWLGPANRDGIYSHIKIMQQTCTLIDAAGCGPRATAWGILGWLDWALGKGTLATGTLRYAQTMPAEDDFVDAACRAVNRQTLPAWCARF